MPSIGQPLTPNASAPADGAAASATSALTQSEDPAEAAGRRLREVVDDLAASQDADVLLYNGDIVRPYDQQLLEMLRAESLRPNAILLLVTLGGDANAAFRVARALQRHYQKFTCYVSGTCKSAGTLVAVGAHELIVCDHGELGPLDVQMRRKDELLAFQSGAVVDLAFDQLCDKAFSAFEQFFLATVVKSGGSLTARTAARIAVDLTTGLLSPVFEHFDPMHVGEAGRSMNIAYHYGRLLRERSDNVRGGDDGLYRLVMDYPTHEFVIDREEAERLFTRVRRPNPVERELASLLGDLSRVSKGEPGAGPVIRFLSRPKTSKEATVEGANSQTESGESADESPRECSGPA